MDNCYLCGNTKEIVNSTSFLKTVCTNCGGKCSDDKIDDDFYTKFMNEIMDRIRSSGIIIVDAPCFIDKTDSVAKVCKTHRFNVDINVDEYKEDVIDAILQKVNDLNLKYVYVVAWNYINGYFIRGSK